MIILNLFSALYFYGIGRPRYFVRSDIVIRKSGNNNSSFGTGISALLGLGNSGSIEDARYLQTFLESPQVLDDLKEVIPFRKLYKKKIPDLYTGINKNISSQEEFDFFRKLISVRLDEVSGILTISSLGLDSDTAFKVNNFLVKSAGEFVDKLNKDIYKIQYDFAKKEVTSNNEKLNTATNELKNFQTENQILDYNQEVGAYGGIILALESELAQQKIELATMKRIFIDPNAPEIKVLEDQIIALQNQINAERKDLVSITGKNLTETALTLDRLKSNVGFRKDVFRFTFLILLKFDKYSSVISLICSRDSISFDKPPPNTIASGSIILIINERHRLKLLLNSFINSISLAKFDLAFSKICFAVRFFPYLE